MTLLAAFLDITAGWRSVFPPPFSVPFAKL